MKTAPQGWAPKDGSVQPKPIASSPSPSTCPECGETPAPWSGPGDSGFLCGACRIAWSDARTVIVCRSKKAA